MPEFMFTSDASNANYASTLVAEGPAVKMFERLQAEHDRGRPGRDVARGRQRGRRRPPAADVRDAVEIQIIAAVAARARPAARKPRSTASRSSTASSRRKPGASTSASTTTRSRRTWQCTSRNIAGPAEKLAPSNRKC